MARRGGIRLVYNRLPDVAQQLRHETREEGKQTAEQVAETARSNAAEDTSSLRESIYVTSPDGSGYDAAVGAAKAVNPEAEFIGETKPPNDDASVVGVAAKHGIFNEFGTTKMAAQPFLAPAAATHKAAHTKRVKDIISKL